ncbi:MAG: hypothetical protein LUF92_17800 [Clostridiales bacterium]|nr:hypothetical protein [Clostridiales bacterium]
MFSFFEVPDCAVKVTSFDEQDVLRADILINATIVGMKPHEEGTVITLTPI